MHFFGAWARQAVIETIAVVYELTKRTQEKLFADWAQKYKAFFVPNQEPASAWIFGNSSVKVGTQGLFHPYLKTFVPPFLPTRVTAPGSPRMYLSVMYGQTFCFTLIDSLINKYNQCHTHTLSAIFAILIHFNVISALLWINRDRVIESVCWSWIFLIINKTLSLDLQLKWTSISEWATYSKLNCILWNI